jgi:hypothetical protein
MLSNLHPQAVLFIALGGVAVLLLLRGFIVSFAARLVRLLLFPIRRIFGKPLAWSRQILRLSRKEVPINSTVGLGVAAASPRTFRETDDAIQNNLDPASIHIGRNGRLFTWVHAAVGSTVEYSKTKKGIALATQDFENAQQFFTTDIKIISNPLNLYDDIDGAFVVNLFKKSDTPCFYVLSQFKEAITRNIMTLAIILSFIVFAVATMNILWASQIDFVNIFDGRLPNSISFFGLSFGAESVNKLIFGALSCSVAYIVMSLFYHVEYKHFQRNNIREMYTFLVKYLAAINNNFKDARTFATQAAVDEQSADKTKQEIILWVTNLQWMAFRAFFIEYFLRNKYFQISRNSRYSLFFIPFVFAAALVATAYFVNVSSLKIFDQKVDLSQQGIFFILFALLLFAYYGFLKKSLPAMPEKVEGEWFGFQEMNILNAMTMIMESYANQLDQWRSRFHAPGTPAGS